MPLHGYDISLEIGRSALNKVLDALEHSPLWTGVFEGDQTQASPQGFLAHVAYKVRLYDIRVRPDKEQEGALESSIALLLNVTGNAVIDVSLDQEPLLNYPIQIDGVLSVVVRFDLAFDDSVHRLLISFRNAIVEEVLLKGLPDDITRILVNGMEFLIQEELRKNQQDLPVTGLLQLSGSPQGELSEIILKTHFYRLLPDDSAVGLGIVLEPGGSPPYLREPLKLHRLANEDLTLSVHENYLNRIIANFIGQSDQAQVGGQLFGFKIRQDSLHLRSASVSIRDHKIFVTIRAGWKHTEFAFQAALVPRFENNAVRLDVQEVYCEIPTWKGVVLQISLNLVAWGILASVDSFVAQEANRRATKIEPYVNGVVVNSKIFQNFPEGLSVKADARGLALLDGNLTLGYAISVEM